MVVGCWLYTFGAFYTSIPKYCMDIGVVVTWPARYVDVLYANIILVSYI